DRGEISSRVVAWLLIDGLIIGMRADAAEQQRIAVWRSIHNAVYTDDARGTGRVLDDHLLAQDFAHTGAKDSTHDVECASRGKRDHHGDRPRRIDLCMRGDRPRYRHASNHADEIAPSHCVPQDSGTHAE